MARRLRTLNVPAEKVQHLTETLNDRTVYDWGVDDGRVPRPQEYESTLDYGRSRFERIQKAWHQVYESLPRSRRHTLKSANAHKADEALWALERMAGFPLPPMQTPEQRKDFRETGVPFLSRQVKRFGIPQFSTEHGARLFLIQLANRLPKSVEQQRLIATLEDWKSWRWSAWDGGLLATSDDALQRFWTAYYSIAVLAQRAGYPIELGEICNEAGAEKFLNALVMGIAVPPFTADDLMLLIDPSHGALAYLKTESATLGVSVFSRDFGAKEAVVTLAKALPSWCKGKAHAVRVLSHETLWGWKKGDGVTAKTGDFPSALRIWRALFWIAQLAADSYDDSGIVPEEIASVQELAQLHSLLLWGVSIPYLTDEQAAACRADVLEFVFERGDELGYTSMLSTPAAKALGAELFAPSYLDSHTKKLEKALGSDQLWDWTAGDLNQAKQSEYFERAVRKVHRMLYANAAVRHPEMLQDKLWKQSQTKSGLRKLFAP